MMKLNDNFRELPGAYLFSEVSHRIARFKAKNPRKEIIRMDIGDIKRPLFPCVIEEMKKAIEDLSKAESFYGYGPEQGYAFLRDKVSEYDYKSNGIHIQSSEIFISDGAKSDLGNLGDILSRNSTVGIPDPSYPAYLDDSIIDGRAGNFLNGKFTGVITIKCDPDNDFMPVLPDEIPDIIYLCFPNNPTGVGITKKELKKWVDFAKKNGILIIYDSAYEAYVREKDAMRSVYEIDGAENIAIEVRSFSKTAGFTGVRCGYTVVPEKLTGQFSNGAIESLNNLWKRRQSTKFNGASYISQRGAAAIYTEEGQKNVLKATNYYLNNAFLIKKALESKGYKAFGGINSPYVWASLGEEKDSWSLFDSLLNEAGISVTPGIGFGKNGNGFVRFTGFNSRENTEKAIENLLKTQNI